MKSLDRRFLKAAWELTRAYWYSTEKWQARGLLSVIIGLNLGHVYILVLLNEWNNRFYNALQNMNRDSFFDALGEFGLLAAAYILVAVYQIYLRQMLEIKWRRWMTEHYLEAWLKDRAYYRLQVLDTGTDNPDQRISEDLRMFAAYTLRLSLGLLRSVVTLVSFIAILWRLSGELVVPVGSWQVVIPGYLVWAAVGYAIVGTWLTVKIGRPLVGLNFNQQRYEADFRFSLVRLRENSESVAFYGGERQERLHFLDRFRLVFSNFRQLMTQQKKLTWFTSGYFQIAIIFPYIVAGPRYFAGQIQLGGLMQIASAFGRVQDALSFIVETYPELAEWRAVVNRLLGFVNHMQEVHTLPANGIKVKRVDGPALLVQELDVDLPNGSALLRSINLSIEPGDSLLITGASGCGKSTLMRSFAGLWPFGAGCIDIPAGKKIMFVPQRPYMPLGTLRDTLLYPNSNGIVTDAAIRSVMVQCRLEEFIDKLDHVDNWSHILSLGEQQRIAFARMLLTQPDWLFLDEATSALDEPTERQLYRLLREKLPNTAIISIGHRNTLHSFHTKKLNLTTGGAWSLLH
ncbi:ABC transporter ATP-binding protein [Anaerosporomusa subterranea]|uniref:ABC transporter ATP-binding protein n=1 Tax=Anaerosporomusa subterranea TaxID=1794912 RepID=A0A154BW53_ANASB|nr:ABC transporter ATP-binding protein/permease [Anaerosporomusa subterranea]KYZ78172.1 ABC transporter ATP-binding protein [Anaerosporomusa subterranea]